VACKIPILIIGNPGSSKSLAINILIKILRAKRDKKSSPFIDQFKKVYFEYHTGSEASTSEAI